MKSFEEALPFLQERTSEQFVDTVRKAVRGQQEIREVMAFRASTEDHGILPGAPITPEDMPTIIVEFLSGWAGEASALWTYWYHTGLDEIGYNVINHEKVERFHHFEKLAKGETV